MTNPMIPARRVATTRRTTQTVASMRRVCASRYIHSAPKTRATMPTRQIPRANTSHSAPMIWNALAIGSRGARPCRYFIIARCRSGRDSRPRGRHFPRRDVRVRAADRRVAHAVLEAAMLALDPDPGGKVVPVPRRLAAPRASLRVERAHGSAHRGTGFEGLRSERPAGQLRFYAQSLAPTLRLDVDRVTDRPLSQSVHEVRDSAEGAAPERREDVANLETPGLRRRSGRDLREEHALAARDAVVRRDPAVDIVARDAEPGPLNVSVFEDLVRDAERRVDRNRKPDTLGERNGRRVDRHDASLQIDERTPAVPRIHRGVRLDHGKAVPRTERQVAAQRTDYAGGDRRSARKAERVPNRQHGLADLELVGVRELRRVEVFPVDLDDRNVRLIVSADDGPAEDAAVREGHDHLARSVDHVMGREDVALTIEEDSGAETSTRPWSPERRTVRRSRRAHVDRTRSHPFHCVDVCVLQVCNHGDREDVRGVC